MTGNLVDMHFILTFDTDRLRCLILALDPDGMSPDEAEEKERLIQQVLELQNTLDGKMAIIRVDSYLAITDCQAFALSLCLIYLTWLPLTLNLLPNLITIRFIHSCRPFATSRQCQRRKF